MDDQKLIKAATEAQRPYLADYSQFPVGAALLTKSGIIYTGCNIESVSYGLTICAERVALFKALSADERDFSAIAIVTPQKQECPPCGACRQLLWEFAGNIQVIMATTQGPVKKMRLAELFPFPFDEGHLPHG